MATNPPPPGALSLTIWYSKREYPIGTIIQPYGFIGQREPIILDKPTVLPRPGGSIPGTNKQIEGLLVTDYERKQLFDEYQADPNKDPPVPYEMLTMAQMMGGKSRRGRKSKKSKNSRSKKSRRRVSRSKKSR